MCVCVCVCGQTFIHPPTTKAEGMICSKCFNLPQSFVLLLLPGFMIHIGTTVLIQWPLNYNPKTVLSFKYTSLSALTGDSIGVALKHVSIMVALELNY